MKCKKAESLTTLTENLELLKKKQTKTQTNTHT